MDGSNLEGQGSLQQDPSEVYPIDPAQTQVACTYNEDDMGLAT